MRSRQELRDEWERLTGQSALLIEPPPARYNVSYCIWLELIVLDRGISLEMEGSKSYETKNSTEDNPVK